LLEKPPEKALSCGELVGGSTRVLWRGIANLPRDKPAGLQVRAKAGEAMKALGFWKMGEAIEGELCCMAAVCSIFSREAFRWLSAVNEVNEELLL